MSEAPKERLHGLFDARLAELRVENQRLRGTLQYIKTQAELRPSGDAMTLSVIHANAASALDDRWQGTKRQILAAVEATKKDGPDLPSSPSTIDKE